MPGPVRPGSGAVTRSPLPTATGSPSAPADRGRGDHYEAPRSGRPRLLAPGVTLPERGLALDGRRIEASRFGELDEVKQLHELAERLTASDRNPFAGRRIGARRRTQVREQLEPFLLNDRLAEGRPGQRGIRSRAAAFALLTQVSQAMETEGEQTARTQLVDSLLAAARLERHEPLQRQMLLGLDGLKRTELSPSQRAERKTLMDRLCPSHPPYDRWFPEGQPAKLKVRQVVMDEFWRAEIADYRRRGYKVEMRSDHRAIARRTIEDPKGKYPPTEVTVELLEGDEDVLQGLSEEDVQVVLYTGHSELGGVARRSFETAPKRAKGDKLVGFFACRGKQWAGELARRYPGTHRLVSNRGTYGHDDRIVIHELIDGICARRSYRAMGRRAEAQELWEKDNYFLPHDRRVLASMDMDRDGKTAVSGQRRDLLFSPSFGARTGRAKSFRPSRSPVNLEKIDAAPLQDAVSWLNTEFNYWAKDFGGAADRRIADRFRADGFFDSEDPDELVRIETSRDQRGQTVARLQVNSAYARADKDALAMLVTYGASMELGRRHDPSASEHALRMRSLAMVGSYVSYVKTYTEDSETLVANFCKRFDFPATIDVSVLERAVRSDHDHEASAKVIKNLERGMQGPFVEVRADRSEPAFRAKITQALRLLRRSETEIGQRTFEAIATGRVRVDRLADLTRDDFEKLAAEYARAGLELPVKRYDRLHDRRVLRGLESDLDGYMWDNRIYVAESLSPKAIAETLVHEVNHVVNRSEENYRGHQSAFLEEYRAHYAEALFRGDEMTAARCRRMKREIVANYGFTKADISAVPDRPPGLLLP